MAILGTSGAGKTFTMQLMALRMRRRNIQVEAAVPHVSCPGSAGKRRCGAAVSLLQAPIFPSAGLEKKLFERSKRNILTGSVAGCYPFTSFEMCDLGLAVKEDVHVNPLTCIDKEGDPSGAHLRAVAPGGH